MPKQINTYTFGQALVRKFGLKGRFQPVLDETIVPVTVVDSSLATRIAIGGEIEAAAGAGNQNLIFFRNPPNSGVLITLKQFWAVSGAPLTDFVGILPGITSSSAGAVGLWRDRRLAGTPVGRTIGIASPAAAIIQPLYHLDNDDHQWIGDWVLAPGQDLQIRQSVQNQTLDITFQWEETEITASVGA